MSLFSKINVSDKAPENVVKDSEYGNFKKILFRYTLGNVLFGCIVCIFIYVLYCNSDYIFNLINIQLEKNSLIAVLGCVCAVIVAGCIVIPVLIFSIIYSPRGLTDLLNQAGLSEKDMVKDYRLSRPMGRINVGNECVYFKRNGVIWVLPYQNISWVYIKVLNKRVVKTKGYSRVPSETISSKKVYTLILKTVYNKTFQIPINNHKYVQQYQLLFASKSEILVGYTDENQQEHKEKVASAKRKTVQRS